MTQPPILNWKRFWCPREGSYRLSDEGYLYDYDSQPLVGESGIVTLGELYDVPCLILLGEPGIGKSTEVLKHSQSLEEKAHDTDDEFLKLNLQNYQTDQTLFDHIFQNPIFQKWVRGKNRLYLILDSLDEALLNINTLSTALPYELKQYPTERLCFRIVSRTAEWPGNMESELMAIWGEKNVLAYELLPLRKQDVEEYVAAEGVDTYTFLNAIKARDAQPFATRPVTLSFLTSIFSQHGDIPESKKELYLEGSRLLCADPNESRIVSRRAGRLTPEQRMRVAGRIAALSVFANKAAIKISSSKDAYRESDLSRESIMGGMEFANGHEFIVGPDEINETLSSGLFSSVGPGRLGWSHRTYSEFLAAWYLTERNFDSSKIMSIITHPGDANQRLIPQLDETAAWIATFSPEVYDLLLDRDPEVLLRSDVLVTKPAVRASLARALLTMHESGKLLDPGWGEFRHYNKLNYPDIGNQLREFINDQNKPFRTRRLAIDIAEECTCLDLQDELVRIALDSEECLPIREQAAHAIAKMGDKNIKLKLKPLTSGIVGNDPNDQLRAYGLHAIWPDFISADELFELIAPHKRDDFIGEYWMFLETSIVKNLKSSDIPIALNWVAKSSTINRPITPYESLMDQIMVLGWNNLEQPGILRPFAQAALSRISHHQGIFSRDFSFRLSGNPQPLAIIENDNEKRHILVREILAISSQISFDPAYLVFGQTPLVFRKDFDWLIATYTTLEDAFQKTAIVGWLNSICDINNLEQMDILLELYETDLIFKQKFSGWFGPIELGSERAIKLKEWYIAAQVEQPRPQLDPPLLERVKGRLEKYEQGDVASWWILNREMTIDEAKLLYGDEFEQDITELPGWKISDSGIRDRIITAAKKYIIDGEPNNKKWMSKNIIFRPAMAGYRALRLVLRESYQDIANMDVSIWQKWASIILAYPMRNSEKADNLDDALLKAAYLAAPEEIERTLAALIRKENRENGFLDGTLNRINCILDEKIDAFLLGRIKHGNLKSNMFRTILGFLLSHRSHSTQDYIVRKLRSYRPDSKKDISEDITVAVQSLLIYCNDLNWEVVWNTLLLDEKLAGDVIEGIACHSDAGKMFSQLSFNQLADLYSYLVNRYPPAKDRDDEKLGGEGLREVSLRESIGDWRDSILNFMANSGAPDACVALRRLMSDLPQFEHIGRELLYAEANMRKKTWIPLSENELLDLLLKPETILVESGLHLLDAIIQSLHNLNASLHGETPAAIFLWNELGNKVYRPRDENRLSDYVKLHLERELQQKGIIVNREVEIRRGNGNPGEITDIHVDAIKKHPVNNGYDKITVIIETKGCWHPELEIAMKTQLLERYLKENRCQFGLYLIGWFSCSQWDPTDPRYQKAPKYSLDEAKTKFLNQAVSLSTEDLVLKSYILDVTL